MAWRLTIVLRQTHKEHHTDAPHQQCDYDADGQDDTGVCIQIRNDGYCALRFGKRSSPVP